MGTLPLITMKCSILTKRQSLRKTNKQANKQTPTICIFLNYRQWNKQKYKTNKTKANVRKLLEVTWVSACIIFCEFILAVYFVFSCQLVLSSHRFFPRYVLSYFLFFSGVGCPRVIHEILWETLYYSPNVVFCRAGPPLGDPRVYKEPGSSEHSNHSVFISSS